MEIWVSVHIPYCICPKVSVVENQGKADTIKAEITESDSVSVERWGGENYRQKGNKDDGLGTAGRWGAEGTSFLWR